MLLVNCGKTLPTTRLKAFFYRIQVRSLPCVVILYVSHFLLLLNFVQICSVKVVTCSFSVVKWICQIDKWKYLSCYMDLSKLIHGFVKIDTWTSLSCYMDLSKLLDGFVKVVTWICQSCSMYFSHFAKQNHTTKSE